MSQEVMVLSTCNQWKEYSSARIIGVFLSETALKEALKKLYQLGSCEWDGKSHIDGADPEQLEEILVEIELEDVRYLNSRLDYVMIETFTSNILED